MLNRSLMASLFLTLLMAMQSAATEGYYRDPDIRGDKIVFTAEGDIWMASLNDLNAVRLTTSPEQETQAKLSPKGDSVAFVANYEGASEIYWLSLKGGVAKRITFENYSVKLQSWTDDGKILYSTNSRVGPSSSWTLHLVDPVTLHVKDIPLADAVNGDLNKNTLVFSQFGLQVSSDNSKVYRGGAMGEIWRFVLDKKSEAVRLTANHKASTSHPKLDSGRVYFVSDKSGNGNIWSMTINGDELKQETRASDFPIRNFAIDGGKIVYQLGADLRLFDVKNKSDKKLGVHFHSDHRSQRERWDYRPMKKLSSLGLQGNQKRVVITARGRVAIANTTGARLIEIATPKDSRTRAAIIDKNGQYIYAINDASGEQEIWRYPATGAKGGKQLTHDGHTFRWQLHLSPNEKMIAHDDQDGNLWILNLASGKNKKILGGNGGLDPFRDIVWSDDSSVLAITTTKDGYERNRILLYRLKDGHHQYLTSTKYNSWSPAFSDDGQWLYFLSDRNFKATPASPWGDRNLGPQFDRRTGIYAVSLVRDAKFPFRAKDELNMVEPSEQKSAKQDEKKNDERKKGKKNKLLRIDWKGIEKRLREVPVEYGNYSNLKAGKKHLYFIDRESKPESKPFLNSLELKPKAKLKKYSDKISWYQLSGDRKNILLLKDSPNKDQIYVVKAGSTMPKTLDDSKIATNTWQILINPKAEWRQLFFDAWILHRDSLFDANMRGVDWNKSRKKYEKLVARIGDRADLNDIFQQMMGELNSLHSQVRGGEIERDKEKSKQAVLGAQLIQTRSGVLIQHIYQNDPELPNRASPLARPGVDAKDGDYLLAINYQPVKSLADVASILRNKVGKQTLLTLKRAGKSIKTLVKPIDLYSDFKLRYFDWVNNNREKVEQQDKDIGYLHIYAMGGNDIADFAREYYANIDKQGLIIDVRRNRGGNIDSWIIEKLLRKSWMFWNARVGKASTNMQQSFRGHLVVLADQMTYSDGETFTAGIKALKLAPVIGKRTAGAGVWLRGQNRLTDGGMARVAEFPQHAMDGRWIVEGYGVEPTIEVDNLPYATAMGKDAQLEAAIKYLQQAIKKQPVKPLKPMPLPKQALPAQDVLKTQ